MKSDGHWFGIKPYGDMVYGSDKFTSPSGSAERVQNIEEIVACVYEAYGKKVNIAVWSRSISCIPKVSNTLEKGIATVNHRGRTGGFRYRVFRGGGTLTNNGECLRSYSLVGQTYGRTDVSGPPERAGVGLGVVQRPWKGHTYVGKFRR